MPITDTTPGKTLIGDEAKLKVIRGSIDTTGSGTILTGSGFTITRNGTGDVTVNFTIAFSAAPAVVVGGGSTAAIDSKLTSSEPVVGSARVLVFVVLTGVAGDGIFHFIAAGPR